MPFPGTVGPRLAVNRAFRFAHESESFVTAGTILIVIYAESFADRYSAATFGIQLDIKETAGKKRKSFTRADQKLRYRTFLWPCLRTNQPAMRRVARRVNPMSILCRVVWRHAVSVVRGNQRRSSDLTCFWTRQHRPCVQGT